MNITSKELVNALQKVITNFEEKNLDKNPSISQIAEYAGASYTTVREIKRGILKNLSIKKAIDMSRRLGGPTTIKELVGYKEDECHEYKLKYEHLEDYPLKEESFESLITNEKFSRIIWAAFSNNHITRTEIVEYWGIEGKEKLNYLLDKGILIEEDGLIKGDSEKAGGDHISAYKQLGIAYKYYNPKNRDQFQNWASLQTNNVNELFISEMRAELVEIFKKFDQKSNQTKYQGNKRMFLGMIFDRYMNESNQVENRGNL